MYTLCAGSSDINLNHFTLRHAKGHCMKDSSFFQISVTAVLRGKSITLCFPFLFHPKKNKPVLCDRNLFPLVVQPLGFLSMFIRLVSFLLLLALYGFLLNGIKGFELFLY